MCKICRLPSPETRCAACEKVASKRFDLFNTPEGKTVKGVQRVGEFYRDVGMSPAVRYHFVDVHNPSADDVSYFAEQNANWTGDAADQKYVPKGLLVFAMYL